MLGSFGQDKLVGLPGALGRVRGLFVLPRCVWPLCALNTAWCSGRLAPGCPAMTVCHVISPCVCLISASCVFSGQTGSGLLCRSCGLFCVLSLLGLRRLRLWHCLVAAAATTGLVREQAWCAVWHSVAPSRRTLPRVYGWNFVEWNSTRMDVCAASHEPMFRGAFQHFGCCASTGLNKQTPNYEAYGSVRFGSNQPQLGVVSPHDGRQNVDFGLVAAHMGFADLTRDSS